MPRLAIPNILRFAWLVSCLLPLTLLSNQFFELQYSLDALLISKPLSGYDALPESVPALMLAILAAFTAQLATRLVSRIALSVSALGALIALAQAIFVPLNTSKLAALVDSSIIPEHVGVAQSPWVMVLIAAEAIQVCLAVWQLFWPQSKMHSKALRQPETFDSHSLWDSQRG